MKTPNNNFILLCQQVAIIYFLSGYILNPFFLFKVMEDRLAQRCLLPCICVYRAWGLSSFWRGTSYCAGVQLPARALWLWKIQTNSYLQSGLKVSPALMFLQDFPLKSYSKCINPTLLDMVWVSYYLKLVVQECTVYLIHSFDFRGRTPDWYNKAFGHLCAAEAARIRNSFQPLITDGPETKIWKSLPIVSAQLLRWRVSLWVKADRQTQGIDRTPEQKHSLFRVQMLWK